MYNGKSCRSKYCNELYTNITTICVVNNSLTTLQLMDYMNVNVRNNLNTNPRYDFELVEVSLVGEKLAPPMKPKNDDTLLQIYKLC